MRDGLKDARFVFAALLMILGVMALVRFATAKSDMIDDASNRMKGDQVVVLLGNACADARDDVSDARVRFEAQVESALGERVAAIDADSTAVLALMAADGCSTLTARRALAIQSDVISLAKALAGAKLLERNASDLAACEARLTNAMARRTSVSRGKSITIVRPR